LLSQGGGQTTGFLGQATDLPPPEVPQLSEPGQISLDRNFYLIIDASGSMASSQCAGRFSSRFEAATWAVKEFATQSIPANVNLGLYAFDGLGARERVPLGKDNRAKVVAEIDRIRGGGGTPLNRSIREGAMALTVQRERQLGYGEFYLVVATDGEASDGDLDKDAVPYALRQRTPIITIGFCLDKGHALSQHSISYRDARNPQELMAALQETQGESPYFDLAAFRRN
jgi:hypothetical protein